MRDDYIQTQLERQYSEPAYSGKRTLDFGPFEEAMKKLSAERIAQLDEKLLDADITALHKMFNEGELTSEELVLGLEQSEFNLGDGAAEYEDQPEE